MYQILCKVNHLVTEDGKATNQEKINELMAFDDRMGEIQISNSDFVCIGYMCETDDSSNLSGIEGIEIIAQEVTPIA